MNSCSIFLTQVSTLSLQELDKYHITFYRKTGPALERKACSFFGKTLKQLFTPIAYAISFFKTALFGTSYQFEYNTRAIIDLIHKHPEQITDLNACLVTCSRLRDITNSVFNKKNKDPSLLRNLITTTSCKLLTDEAAKQHIPPHDLACNLNLFYEAELFINHGQNINDLSQQNKNRFLGYALDQNNFVLAIQLLNAGADPKTQKEKLKPLLHYFLDKKNSQMAIVLLDAGADRGQGNNSVLRRSVVLGLLPVIQKLEALGEVLTTRDEQHNSLLHLAAKHSHFEVLTWLSTKVDVSHKNHNSSTAYDLVKHLPFFINKPPLEKAFLLQDIPQCGKILASLGQERAILALNDLRGTYPASYINHILYSVDTRHFYNQQLVALPAAVAPGCRVDELLELFDQVNFSDANAEHYADPATFEADTQTRSISRLKSMLTGFVRKVVNRTAYVGTPAHGAALEAFYSAIERAVTHTISQIKNMPDSNQKRAHIKRLIVEFLRASSYCGGKLYATACQQYIAVTTGQMPTFADELHNILGSYREVLFQTSMPDSNVHTFNHVMRTLGEELGIPGAEMMQGFHDMYGGYNIDQQSIRSKFNSLYTPANIILECIKPALEQSGELRNKLFDWFKENIPHEWQHEEFQGIFDHVQQLEEEDATRKDVTDYLQTKDIYALPNQTAQQAINDERKMRYLALEVVVNMEAVKMEIKPEAIAYMLAKLGILQPVYDSPAYYGRARMITAKIGHLLSLGRDFFSSLLLD